MFKEIEHCFNRAFWLSFEKRKFFLTFFTLFLCSVFIVFCRTVAFGVGDWLALSLLFLPIFGSAIFLLSLGVLLARIYNYEVKSIKIKYSRIIGGSWNLIAGTFYLSLFPILLYLVLWVILGFFLLLKEIPIVGNGISIVLAFAPFALIFCSILLSLFTLWTLFFVSPAIAFKSKERMRIGSGLIVLFRKNIFMSMLLFFLGLLPALIAAGFLTLTALLTKAYFIEASHILFLSVSWFVIAIPFAIFLTPCVNFFFNFATEAYTILEKRVYPS